MSGEVKRITLNADARLLRQAQEVLGTTTATDTINRSLAEVVRRHRLGSLAERRFPDLAPQGPLGTGDAGAP